MEEDDCKGVEDVQRPSQNRSGHDSEAIQVPPLLTSRPIRSLGTHVYRTRRPTSLRPDAGQKSPTPTAVSSPYPLRPPCRAARHHTYNSKGDEDRRRAYEVLARAGAFA